MAKNTSKIKRAPGRISEYDLEYHPEMAFRLCSLGLTDEQLSIVFGISHDTIHEWKGKHPEFANELSRGKMIADAEVAHSLFQRATGYDQIEYSLVEVQVDEKTTDFKQVKTIRHIPADVSAAELWLRNRTNFFNRRKREITSVELADSELSNVAGDSN